MITSLIDYRFNKKKIQREKDEFQRKANPTSRNDTRTETKNEIVWLKNASIDLHETYLLNCNN